MLYIKIDFSLKLISHSNPLSANNIYQTILRKEKQKIIIISLDG